MEQQQSQQPLKVLFVGSRVLQEKLFRPEPAQPTAGGSGMYSHLQPDPPIGAWILTRSFSLREPVRWETCSFSSNGGRGSHEAIGRMVIEVAPTVDAIVFLGEEQSTTMYSLREDQLTGEFKNKPLIFVQSSSDWNSTIKYLEEKKCKQYVHLDSERRDLKKELVDKLSEFYAMKGNGEPLTVKSQPSSFKYSPSKYCCSVGFFTLTGVGVGGVAIAGALGITGVFVFTPAVVALMAASLIAAVLFLVLGLRYLNASKVEALQRSAR